MEAEKKTSFERNTFGKRLKSMLRVDFRRMLTGTLFYIAIGACLVMPIVILVMTTMMDGNVSVNPQTGVETVIEGFDNVWQIIGTVGGSGSSLSADMGITSMCNINLLYFFIAAVVCIFTAEDFRSGYCKNIFAVRAKKSDYVISKTVVCFISGVLMIAAFFIGALLGGAISGLPFEMTGFGVANLVLCLLSKMLLVSVFVPIYVLMSVIAKQRLWLSIVLSAMIGAFLFMMIPMLTPLNATAFNTILCLVGGTIFSVGLGAVSNAVLKKTSLI